MKNTGPANAVFIKMKVLIVICLLFFPIGYASAFECRVTKILDGDTVVVMQNSQRIIIQLAGIDAPEISEERPHISQPFSWAAKDFLSGLILNSKVQVHEYGRDTKGIIQGEIHQRDLNVNLEMIKAGLAEVLSDDPYTDLNITDYMEAEVKARDNAMGIWNLRDQYFSPAHWREMYGK